MGLRKSVAVVQAGRQDNASMRAPISRATGRRPLVIQAREGNDDFGLLETADGERFTSKALTNAFGKVVRAACVTPIGFHFPVCSGIRATC